MLLAGTVPGRTGNPAPGGPGGPGCIKPPGSSPGPGGGTEEGGIRMTISGVLERRWCATYKVLLGSGDSSRREADRCEQKHHEVLLDDLPHRGPASHSTNSYTSSARVAVPKRLSA